MNRTVHAIAPVLGLEESFDSTFGNFLLLEALERDYIYPRLGDRLEPAAWTEAGAHGSIFRFSTRSAKSA